MTTTIANIARAINMNPKAARAKLRRLNPGIKLEGLTKAEALKAAQFLSTDHRV